MKPHREKPVIVQILHSFRYAAVGLRVLSRDRNMLVHVAASVVVIVAGSWFRVSAIEWAVLVMAMALVMSLEAMNSALEYAVDLASPDLHPLAGKAKDVASAAVLIAAIGAAAIGVLIFAPRLFQ